MCKFRKYWLINKKKAKFGDGPLKTLSSIQKLFSVSFEHKFLETSIFLLHKKLIIRPCNVVAAPNLCTEFALVSAAIVYALPLKDRWSQMNQELKRGCHGKVLYGVTADEEVFFFARKH